MKTDLDFDECGCFLSCLKYVQYIQDMFYPATRTQSSSYAQYLIIQFLVFSLSIDLNMCFGCSKEPSHRDGSFEYLQHMFWLKISK